MCQDVSEYRLCVELYLYVSVSVSVFVVCSWLCVCVCVCVCVWVCVYVCVSLIHTPTQPNIKLQTQSQTQENHANALNHITNSSIIDDIPLKAEWTLIITTVIILSSLLISLASVDMPVFVVVF